jgi:hypothetical protein
MTKERPLHPDTPISDLTQEQIVDVVVEELLPLVGK